MSNIPKTRLLFDSPAEIDAFGSHGKIAQAIADLIQDEDGGRSIGLEGKWGSGKSTIVQLIASALKEKQEDDVRSEVVVFDAWHHQGDPLRRTFLETLIRELQSRKWLEDSDTWEDRKSELAGRKTNERSKSYPGLTRLGKWSAPAVLTVPIGLAFLNMSFSGNGYLMLRNAFFVIGLIFTLYPLLPIIMWFQRKRDPASDSEKEDWIGLFLSNTVTHTNTTTTISPEPTSIEFEKTFNDLMLEVLSDDTRRLVLVIDNLDRVPADDAQEIWTSLRVFLERRRRIDHPWMDHFWLIVPYDRQGIAQLWQRHASASGSHENEGNEGSLGQATNRNSALSVVAESFLDKSFQTRFFVPDIVLSNWRGFLFEQLTEAFPLSSDDSKHETARLVAQYRRGIGPPTPRGLKLLVNQLGVTYRIWGDRIPLSIQAMYALHYRDGHDVRDLLLSKQLQLLIFGEDERSIVFDQMAALHYSVEIDEARQLLLRSPIEEAMETQDLEQIDALANTGDGFWAVLESIADESPAAWDSDLTLIGNWADSFHRAKTLSNSKRSEAKTVRSWIVRSAEELPWSRIPELDERTANQICAVMRLSQESSLVHRLVSKVTAPVVTEDRYVSEDSIPQWADAMLRILGQIAEIDPNGKRSLRIVPPATTADCARMFIALGSQRDSEQYWQHFSPNDMDEMLELVEEGIGQVTGGAGSDVWQSTLQLSDVSGVVDVLDAGALSSENRQRLMHNILTQMQKHEISPEYVPSLVKRFLRFGASRNEL